MKYTQYTLDQGCREPLLDLISLCEPPYDLKKMAVHDYIILKITFLQCEGHICIADFIIREDTVCARHSDRVKGDL